MGDAKAQPIINLFKENGKWKFPDEILVKLKKKMDLDYGSNPGQRAAFYRIEGVVNGLPDWKQVCGDLASFNNLREAGLTNRLLKGYEDRTAMAVAKHGIYAGFAFASTVEEARKMAMQCDPQANLGGVEVYNRELTLEIANAIKADAEKGDIRDVIAAPKFESGALEILENCRKQKGRMRAFEVAPLSSFDWDIRVVDNGVLIEELPDYSQKLKKEDYEIVSQRQPTDAELALMLEDWYVVWRAPSNGVIVGDGRYRDGKVEAFWTYGIGTSTKRNRAAQMAVDNANDTDMLADFDLPVRLRADGAVGASDGFFPRVDGLLSLLEGGVDKVISGKGGVHTPEVRKVADEHKIVYGECSKRGFSH